MPQKPCQRLKNRYVRPWMNLPMNEAGTRNEAGCWGLTGIHCQLLHTLGRDGEMANALAFRFPSTRARSCCGLAAAAVADELSIGNLPDSCRCSPPPVRRAGACSVASRRTLLRPDAARTLRTRQTITQSNAVVMHLTEVLFAAPTVCAPSVS